MKHLWFARLALGALPASLAGFLLSANLDASIYEVTIQPRKEEAFGVAHYRLWLPSETPQLRGLFFRQHGCGDGARKKGLDHANDIQWQSLAQKHGFALMASELWAPEEDCSTWTMPKDGSLRAFLTALESLAQQSKHPELTSVPWCLWGHSGGAIWAMNMTFLHPERVIATFPRSGGLSPVGATYSRSQPQQFDSNPEALQVPILFCFGAKEEQEGNRFNRLIQGVRNVFAYGRDHEAPWAVAIDPDAEHENAQSRQIAIRFFDTVIPQRLPDPLVEAAALRPLPVEQTWIGHHQSRQVEPRTKDAVSNKETSYLLNASFAQAWQHFSLHGSIPDLTPPPRPYNLRAIPTQGGNMLRWQAWADIESGIRQFELYRQDELVAIIDGSNASPGKHPDGIHSWNYHDQPWQPSLEDSMQWFDKGSSPVDFSQYAIASRNKQGLLSEKTTAMAQTAWQRRQSTPWQNLSESDFLDHWQGSPSGMPPKGWRVHGGILGMDPDASEGSSSLYSKKIYGDFEMSFQYRIGKGGNSGVKYRMKDYDGQYLGPEYQILDDDSHYPGYLPGVDAVSHYITGTLYVLNMGSWALDPRHPPGTWNQGRLVVIGNRIEHWLNGVLIVQTSHDTKAFKDAVAVSKFGKWSDYGQNAKGRIMLQDHGTGVSFRHVKIRSLDTDATPDPAK